MRELLKLASRACETNSPSPMATWMKFHNGYLAAYGGTFCVQVPCEVDADCAFTPAPLQAFFRKDRTKTSYTVKDDKLIVKSGRERVTVKCLPGEKMPLIDVHREVTAVKGFLPQKALKAMLSCIDGANPRSVLQGMCIRNGVAIGTDDKVLLAIVTKLPKDITCVVPTETVKFLSTIDEDVCGVACDSVGIKFVYPSGLIVVSRVILADEFPSIQHIVDSSKGREIELHEDTLSELNGLKTEKVTVSHSGIGYRTGNDTAFGDISLRVEDEFAFTVNKELFELMLNLTLKNRVLLTEEHPSALHANGGKHFKMVLALMRSDTPEF